MKKVSVIMHTNILSLAWNLNVIRYTAAGEDLFNVCKALDLVGSTVQSTLKIKTKSRNMEK